MKSTTVAISEILKGTGCMSALRFTGGCFKCDYVMKCPNEQAKIGRVRILQIKQAHLLSQLEDISRLIDEAEQRL
jgi:uncharacterized Fe-S cluster-containing MiaB family protein